MTDLQIEKRIQIFQQFIQQLTQHNVQQLLSNAQKNYAVREFKISHFLPSHALEIYKNIAIKSNRNPPQSELNWWENQLRIFVWTLVLFVQIHQTKIQTLTIQHWSFFLSLFPHKQLILFQYQSINILKQHNQAKKWIPQEDAIFIKLVHQNGLRCKWSELAKLLYIESEKKYFRTPKQCRERWLNHLDPSKSKSEWQMREDFILISYVYMNGKKWAQISKQLQNKRNQHSIKNRFKSLMTKQIKFHAQQLPELQLIESIYNRYKTYLSEEKNMKKIALNKKSDSRQFIKVQPASESRMIRSKIQKFTEQKGLEQNLSYPFTCYSKHESFTPYKISEQSFHFSKFQKPSLMPTNNVTNTFKQDKDGFPLRSRRFMPIECFPFNRQKSGQNYPIIINGKVRQRNQEQRSFMNFSMNPQMPQRVRKFPFPNEYYEPQNYFYSDLVLNQHYGASSEMELGSDYEQFLPVEQDQQSQKGIMKNKIQFGFKNEDQLLRVQKDQKIDEYEKKIRAEIFLVQNPMDIVKNFFYHNQKERIHDQELARTNYLLKTA